MPPEPPAEQRPLLPEALSPGVAAAVARRTPPALARFFGREPEAGQGDGSEARAVAGVCILRVTETNLVHYTKKPKTAAKIVGDSAEAEKGSETPPVDEKYWKRRYNYFARFDEGVRMDPAAWFEVTPESVARHIADCMQYDLVVDGTCGVGGNAIQFAMTSRRVIAVDTDAARLSDASHNASVYGVQERIQFVHDDFAHFAASYGGPPIDAVFLSPPWGGPQHLDAEYFSLLDVPCPDIVKLFAAAVRISQRVVLYLPRHTDLHEMAMLAAEHGFPAVKVEKIFFQYPTPHLKLCVVYFTPEAAVAPMEPGSAKKAVGPTGGPGPPAPKRNPARGRKDRPAAGARGRGAGTSEAGAAAAGGLLGLPPLAGPVIRALYCRYHYVGRYVVALALAQEREQGPAPARRPERGRGATEGRRVAGGPEGAGADLHGRVARALCEALGPDPDADVQGCLAWILNELPLADVLRLVGDAEAERGEHGAHDGGGERPGWSGSLFPLLRRRLPDLHHRLVQWRKGVATAAISAVGEG